jgi:phage shock protein PspC (stress-responsive transcriptional regulator)
MTSYRLTRNLLDRVLGGVGGGIGAYMGISGWWVRLAFIALAFTSIWFAVLGYVLLWMLIPAQTLDEVPPILPPSESPQARFARPETMLILGALAIVIGVLVLAQSTGVMQGPQGDLLAPGMLFVVGLVLLVKHFRGRA